MSLAEPPSPSTCPPESCRDCRLRPLAAFAPLQDGELAHIQQFRRRALTLAAGAMVIPEHRRGGQLFTLYAGWAFRFKTLRDGRRQILNFLLPGDFIGLQEEFADGATPGVEAVTEVQLCVFPLDGLWPMFQAYPKLGYDVTWLAAREEHWVDQHLLTAGRRSAMERVAMLLMHLYRRGERLGMVQGGELPFPITQQHIADVLGLSLVHTNKTLRRLHRLGLHSLEEGRLRLLDPHALEHLADYYERPLRQSPLI
ncbi:MAG: Crp/Fnr family transcriptional regulator [Ramlibacter sp.]|nr:Crp/Fnr family transcriptional regulator [Ramlibacter sp.]